MSPPYIFRIDEIREDPNTLHHLDNSGNWNPSTEPGANVRAGGGASGRWWYCNRQRIYNIPQLPQGSTLYKIFSVYYSAGFGFWVYEGDATSPRNDGNAWHPLRFDREQDFSSYLTNAGSRPTLSIQRPDQQWPRMLLPDIYHTPRLTASQDYGGLIGELAIFLALIAFSVRQESLTQVIPNMFTGGAWRTHNYHHGRLNQRGVVVYVYTAPSTWDGGSDRPELERYEGGQYGKYFN